jgi:5'-deoxynucleotidase YfbR-like HD superfamily hydrolase
MNLIEDPKFRDLAHVPRWAIARTNRQQSVAEHSYYVTLYAIAIAQELEVPITGGFISYCLLHDMDEIHTGDLVCKIADWLEAAIFVAEEKGLGNRTMDEIFNDVMKNFTVYMNNAAIPDDLTNRILHAIKVHHDYKGRAR